ncbi:DoxX family protein [Taibaiella soli]|uniref:DoxX family protein n=2 Tax=Taibaiella soli TaxID=1649169 RepID=A0A2W2BVR3_9BACT|nr:DoxX family protein [Taibaiella soli]
MVGAVFLSEGIQKFLFAEKLGVGRFAKIGIPNPDFFAPFVGTFEIICGTLILIGLCTRLAAIPLLAIMLVAIATTKAQLLADNGFWSMLHDSRTDWSMLLGCIFLILKGSGGYSLDRKLSQV